MRGFTHQSNSRFASATCHHARMPPRFRLAELEDLPPLLDMIRDFHRGEGIASPAEAVEAAVRVLLGRSTGRIWMIADENGATAGYMVLTFGFSIEFEGRDAFVDELYLKPEYRGRGWGTAAVEFAAAAASELGIKALHLEADRGKDRVVHLYRSLGFREHDRFLMTRWLTR